MNLFEKKTCFRSEFPYGNWLTMVIITITEQFMKKKNWKNIKKYEKKKTPFLELSFKTKNKSLYLSEQLLFCDSKNTSIHTQTRIYCHKNTQQNKYYVFWSVSESSSMEFFLLRRSPYNGMEQSIVNHQWTALISGNNNLFYFLHLRNHFKLCKWVRRGAVSLFLFFHYLSRSNCRCTFQLWFEKYKKEWRPSNLITIMSQQLLCLIFIICTDGNKKMFILYCALKCDSHSAGKVVEIEID